MLKILKKIIMVIIVIGLISTQISIRNFAATTSDSVKVYFNTLISYAESWKRFKELKEMKTYGPLTMDSMLRVRAFTRARELAVYYARNERPNGDKSRNAGTDKSPQYYTEFIESGWIDTSEEGNPELHECLQNPGIVAAGCGNCYVNGQRFEVILLSTTFKTEAKESLATDWMRETSSVNILPKYLDLTQDKKECVMNVGDEETLNIRQNGILLDGKSFDWKTSDNYKVSVGDGKVYPKAPGNATITASIGDQALEFNLNIYAPLKNIKLSNDSINMDLETEKQLYVTYVPSNTTDTKDLIWTSSNNFVASVDETGKVKANGVGTTLITVTSKADTTLKATCEVKVDRFLESIELDKKEMEMQTGDESRLTVTYNPSDTTQTKELVWESSDETVAKVDESGNVKALKAGTATISVRSALGRFARDECKVTVSDPVYPLESISLNTNDLNIPKGRKADLQVSYIPSNTTDSKKITWMSTNEDVAKVDENGQVEAIKEGTTIIIAKVGDKTAICRVTVTKEVIDLIDISLNKNELSLVEGDEENLVVIYNPENTTEDKTIEWSTSDESIAKVDNNGKITAISEGSAVITAKVGDKIAKCNVHVEKLVIQLISIRMNTESMQLEEGNSGKLGVICNPINTTANKKVTWISSDEDIATVDEDGNVTAIKEGTALIIAIVEDKTTTCSINVIKQSEAQNMKGDVNGDGKINVIDCTAILKHIKGTKLLSEDEQSRADINGDGKINVIDCTAILKHIKGTKLIEVEQ